MPEKPNLDRAQRRRKRYAERKLHEAQQRLTRTERSIKYWSRVLADLKYGQNCAVQRLLWPEEQVESDRLNLGGHVAGSFGDQPLKVG
jgi:hypothetical protein